MVELACVACGCGEDVERCEGEEGVGYALGVCLFLLSLYPLLPYLLFLFPCLYPPPLLPALLPTLTSPQSSYSCSPYFVSVLTLIYLQDMAAHSRTGARAASGIEAGTGEDGNAGGRVRRSGFGGDCFSLMPIHLIFRYFCGIVGDGWGATFFGGWTNSSTG